MKKKLKVFFTVIILILIVGSFIWQMSLGVCPVPQSLIKQAKVCITMKTEKIWSFISLIVGIVISAIGIVLIVAYIQEAYIARRGEPDQSLLFWYLPILFMGFIVLGSGLCTIIGRFSCLKKIRQSNSSGTTNPRQQTIVQQPRLHSLQPMVQPNLEVTATPSSPVPDPGQQLKKWIWLCIPLFCAYNEKSQKCEIIVKLMIKIGHLFKLCLFKVIIIMLLTTIKLFLQINLRNTS